MGISTFALSVANFSTLAPTAPAPPESSRVGTNFASTNLATFEAPTDEAPTESSTLATEGAPHFSTSEAPLLSSTFQAPGIEERL